MSRDKRRHSSPANPPFVQVFKSMLKEPAWQDLSYGARWLYITVKGFYNGRNNGKFYMGVRRAAKELGASRSSTERWFRELQGHGFLRQTRRACLGTDGNASATYWRLTEVGYMDEQATREYKTWKPESKTKPCTENRVEPSLKSGRGRHENRDRCPDNEDCFRSDEPPNRPDNRCISNLPCRGRNSADGAHFYGGSPKDTAGENRARMPDETYEQIRAHYQTMTIFFALVLQEGSA